jgi:hypothetical protein
MKEFTRRDFLKTTAALGAAAILPAELAHGAERVEEVLASPMFKETKGGLIVPPAAGLPITGTFLDEISHDIPHQNWGYEEWDRDFQAMKAIGYKEIVPFLRGESTWEETDYLLKLNTRHYAKRQLTWMRREEDVLWVEALAPNAYQQLEQWFTQGE